MSQPAYTLYSPESPRSCVVFSSPHSGNEYPEDLLAMTRLDSHAIRSSEDAFVDRLFVRAPDFGAPLIAARFPRAYVDLNRADNELDPALVRGVRYHGINPRIAAGLGVIPRVVGGHRAIRSGKISLHEANRRINLAYRPYHARLAALLEEHHARFGIAILVDCHSMPHEAISHMDHSQSNPPDVVVGDRFGTSASGWITEAVTEIFASAGFRVARNKPFAGGYITQKYGRPTRNHHAVQVEINRSVYMNERTIRPREDFAAVCDTMADITRQIADLGCATDSIAAE